MNRLWPPVGAEDHVQGPLSAALVIVEYGDFQCPYCGAAYRELKQVRDVLGDGLCLVFRNFPLTRLHLHALGAAMFAEAAATIGRFWEMHDMLFEHQTSLDQPSLTAYARTLDLDAALIVAAQRGNFMERVRHDVAGGVHSGVAGTPTLFINGFLYKGSPDARSLLALA